jgi:hypothetical protein
MNLRAVYVTCGSPIKSSEDVQKSTFPGAGFTDNGQHFPLHHLKGQIVKEHQIRLPGFVNLSEPINPKRFNSLFYS